MVRSCYDLEQVTDTHCVLLTINGGAALQSTFAITIREVDVEVGPARERIRIPNGPYVALSLTVCNRCYWAGATCYRAQADSHRIAVALLIGAEQAATEQRNGNACHPGIRISTGIGPETQTDVEVHVIFLPVCAVKLQELEVKRRADLQHLLVASACRHARCGGAAGYPYITEVDLIVGNSSEERTCRKTCAEECDAVVVAAARRLPAIAVKRITRAEFEAAPSWRLIQH